jgi:NDP-sugar pyrophosphorylase family protein
MAGLEGITAAILVGGFGTRLHGVVNDRPKPLALVNNRPFLSYLLDQLAEAGAASVVFCSGHLGQLVEEKFQQEYRGLRLSYSLEAVPLGTGGALRLAAAQLASDPVLVMNGDSYCEADLGSFLSSFRHSAAEAAILLTQVAETAPFGQVHLDTNGRITRFSEKGTGRGPGLINAGIYLILRARFLTIPADRPVSLEREIFPSWVGSGMIGWSGGRRFLDIGTPESLRSAGAFLETVAPGRGGPPL